MDWKRKTWLAAALLACAGLVVTQSWATDGAADGREPVKASATVIPGGTEGDSSAAPATSGLIEKQPATPQMPKFEAMHMGYGLPVPAESEEAGTAGAREGGETCDNAVVIAALPFTDSGDTRDNFNNYTSPNCNDDPAQARDVVYKYTPTSNTIIKISMCQTSSTGVGNDDTRLWVYQDSCDGINEITCNDDATSGCPDNPDPNDPNRGRQAEIPALAVTANTDYFIIVDGWQGNNGTYRIDVRELGNGACCAIVGGQTCSPNVSVLECLCLAERFTEGGACTTPTCVADPTGCGCPPNEVFGPGFHDGVECATDGTSFFLNGADDFFGTTAVDAFWNVDQPIKFVQISWIYALLPGLGGACDKADEFTVTFYEDECGAPGDIAAGPFSVTGIPEGTGFVFGGSGEIERMLLPLPVSVSMSTGWVGVSSKTDLNNPNCVGRGLAYANENTAAGLTGDEKSWLIGTGPGLPFVVNGDLALCLAAPADPGACCNDATGVCTDNTLPAACPPPNRFADNQTCASLSPACGEGACCTPDGNCALTTLAGCSGTWKGGVACEFANCPPSNDTCSLVPIPPLALSYTFNNRTNGATDDDCADLGAPSGWEVFGLADSNDPPGPDDDYSCYDVVLDYCGTSPIFVGDAYEGLLDACCDFGLEREAVSTSTTARVGACCRDEPPGYDGNLSLTFQGVPSNPSWYYPVLAVGGSLGDYTLNVNATAMSSDNIGDANGDGRKDLGDYALVHDCISGPNVPFTGNCACLIDSDADNDVDLGDYAKYQAARTACTSCTGASEGEAACAGVNDGCDAVTPAFGALSCGQTVCGTAGDGDSDWYAVTLVSSSTLTWTVSAEFPADIALLDGRFGAPSCEGNVAALVIDEASGSGCESGPMVASACLNPGTYWVRVAPQEGAGVTCGSAYKGTVTCSPCTPTESSGACCQADANGASPFTLVCTPNVPQSVCEASEGNYQGDGSLCPCPPAAAGDECQSPLAIVGASGSINFTRSSLTSAASDPVSACELNGGGPFAKDGSVWFRWRSSGFGTQRLNLWTCCNEGGAGDDTIISVYRRPGTENNVPSISCPAILAGGDAADLHCDDDTCVATGVGGAQVCVTGPNADYQNRDFYILVEIYEGGTASERENFTLSWTTANCSLPTCPPLPTCGVPVACPGGAIQENEPATNCNTDAEDNYNSGCNPLSRVPPDPEAFNGPALTCPAPGETVSVCGTAGYFNTTGGAASDRRRDTDWYELVLTEETTITWSVNSQTEGAQALVIDSNDCDNAIVLLSAADLNAAGEDPATGCGAQTVSGTLSAGRYAVFASFLDPAAGTSNENVLCPQPYVGTLSCDRGDILATPADACGGAPVISAAGRYSGLFGPAVGQTPDGESTCDGDLGAGFCTGPEVKDVYWTYTAPCTGKVSFEVREGPAPMVLSAHSACSANCDNELPGGLGASCSSFGGGPGGALPKITLDVKSGVSYRIRLAAAVDGPYELLVSDCVTCCEALPSPNCPECGNGEVQGAEECDDGDNDNGDGCDAYCRIE